MEIRSSFSEQTINEMRMNKTENKKSQSRSRSHHESHVLEISQPELMNRILITFSTLLYNYK